MMLLRKKEREPFIIISISSETTRSVDDGPSVSNSVTLLHMTLEFLFLALMRIQLALVTESICENLKKANFPSGLPKLSATVNVLLCRLLGGINVHFHLLLSKRELLRSPKKYFYSNMITT